MMVILDFSDHEKDSSKNNTKYEGRERSRSPSTRKKSRYLILIVGVEDEEIMNGNQ